MKIIDRKNNADIVSRIEKFIESLPTWTVLNLNEIVIFNSNLSSLYVSTGSDGEYFSEDSSIAISNEPNLGTIEDILSHEIGHHVINNSLTTEQKFELWSLDNDWKEDFASCFGFYFTNKKHQARQFYPNSYKILIELIESKEE